MLPLPLPRTTGKLPIRKWINDWTLWAFNAQPPLSRRRTRA